MIFEKVALGYGHENASISDNGFSYRCPGDDICERFTGTEDSYKTFAERVENVCAGCGDCKGNGPIDPKLKNARDKLFSYSEAEQQHDLLIIENYVDKFLAGYPIDHTNLSQVYSEGMIFWLKISRHFDNEYKIKLVALINGLAKSQ